MGGRGKGGVIDVEEATKRHEMDIKELRLKLEGMPTKLKDMENQMTALTKSIGDFIIELRKGYVSNEMCNMCRVSMEKEIKTNADTTRFLSRALWTGVATGCSLLVGIVLSKLELL